MSKRKPVPATTLERVAMLRMEVDTVARRYPDDALVQAATREARSKLDRMETGTAAHRGRLPKHWLVLLAYITRFALEKRTGLNLNI